MSSTLTFQPITIYGKNGPNPTKVRMLCEELGVPYVLIDTPFTEIKKPSFLAINPNGRLPAIYDPNTSLTLWESGAIIEYLVEKYDPEHKLCFPKGSNEAQLVRQWLYFQVSGQGPYYGQATWFAKYHVEQVESAKKRYCREIERVTGVLDAHLRKQDQGLDGPWLVGGRFSFADLAFVPWQIIIEPMLEGNVDLNAFTEVQGWIKRMKKREGIMTVIKEIPGTNQ